jgi:hypothetical protein
MFASVELRPDGPWLDADRDPQGYQMIKQVDAFAHQLAPVTTDAFNKCFDCLLAHFLGDPVSAPAEHAGSIG